MADSEIAAMVDPKWLEKTKAGGDEHPIIKAFTIAHEGNSNIRLDGVLTPIRWARDAIEWVYDKLALFTPVFNQHGPPGDNSHEGREVIGEIVGSRKAKEGDKAATIEAMYIRPPFHKLKLDMASIEADITYAKDKETAWLTGINEITGIALGDRRMFNPGFPEATLIGSIAAFGQGEETVNIKEVKSAVGVLELKPEDVFSPEALTGSDSVRNFIIKEKKDAQEHTRRVSDEKEELRKELEEKYGGEIATLKTENLAAKTSTVFTTISEERKLDDAEKNFVSRQLRHFASPSGESEKLKDEMNVFVDAALEDLGLLKPDLGIKSEEGEGEGDKQEVDSPGSTEIEDEMMDPDKNSLIPGGKADLEYNK